MRSSAALRIDAPPASGGVYYSEALAPLFLHPVVQRLDEARRRELLVLHLHAYLEFTVRLERGPVKEAIDGIDGLDGVPWLDEGVRAAARGIGAEEQEHGAMYERLAREVEEATGVTPIRGVEPELVGRVRALVEGAGPALGPWVRLFFVIVSETLITGDLRRLRRDPRVVPEVRAVVDAHARDEARHHLFFSDLCAALWPRLDPDLRRALGLLLPELIGAYLGLDRAVLGAMLARYPEVFPRPARIVEEVAMLSGPLADRARAAAPSVGAFQRCGVLQDPIVARAFADAGWVRGAAQTWSVG